MVEFFKKLWQDLVAFFKRSRTPKHLKSKNKLGKGQKNSDSDSEFELSGADRVSVVLSSLKMISDFFYIVVLLVFMLVSGLGVGYLASQIDSVKVPDRATLVMQVRSISLVSTLAYANGHDIAEVDTDLQRSPVKGEDIGSNIKQAVIATEDENFKSHHGVVPKAVFRALVSSVLGVGSNSGGSTLTQQLVKQQVVGDDPTFKRKAREIIYSLALERYMTKDTILTSYLNVSPFGRNNKGENIAGVEEAAKGIFGVSSKALTVPQAAYIAGLPQSPITYSPYAADGRLKDQESLTYGLKRQQAVLYNMYRAGYLSKRDYRHHRQYDIQQDFIASEESSSVSHDYLYYAVMEEAQQHMYDYLIKRDEVSQFDLKNDETVANYQQLALEALQTGGYRVTTTINENIYKAMQESAQNSGGQLDAGNSSRVDVGNVLMDNKTGGILGFVGGRDYKVNQNNHALDTKRSPGSSIKPIIAYGIALDQGMLGSASILSNYPATFSGGTKIMHGNDEGTGAVSLQEALDTSWNIPAYWTYRMLQEQGVDVEAYMTKMGYQIDHYDIESLPLGGGIETTVLQQTNAYQTLANEGIYQKGYMVQSITDNKGRKIYEHAENPIPVYGKEAASIMTDLLKGPIASGKTTKFKDHLTSINAGLASNIDWIGKTGTTDNYSDVWLMLSTPTVTLGGWAGYDNNASMSSNTGYENNAQYMANLVNAIDAADSSVFGGGQKFSLASNVIKSTVLKSTGLKPATVSHNGNSINLSGETTTSNWAKNGAGDTTYSFMVGGSDSDDEAAWKTVTGQQ
ncbi:penicillin-binding protein PBP1B [Streptococcus dentasini]